MRPLLGTLLTGLLAIGLMTPAHAEDTIKIGVIIPLTGPFTSTGLEIQGATRLYMKQHGDTVAGKKIELIIRDDGGVPDTTKRIATEMVVKDHVAVIAGMGLTPLALAVAPIVTKAKIPLVIMGAATSTIPSASPFIVRTSFAVPQGIAIFGEWAASTGLKTIVTLVADYAPGIDTEIWFKKSFEAAGGKVVESIRVPLANPDFAPFLQRAADAHADALFAFVPSGQGGVFARQFNERGLAKTGMKLLATGDVLDEQLLDTLGENVVGLQSIYHYSDQHDSALNKTFVTNFKADNGIRPNMMAVGGYDGMALIYQALAKTNGDTDGEKLIEAMKGTNWESPRGPVSIDPNTREIVQNEYLRKVERLPDGTLGNIEQKTFPNIKDPGKTAN